MSPGRIRLHSTVDTDAVAERLYGLPPQEFIAARNADVAEAKKIGDTRAAKLIAELRKPSTSAWLANSLVRKHPDEFDALLRLGTELRSAHKKLDGAALRELGQQRRQVVRALLRQAAALHRPLSDSIERELEETFTTALSDPDAATALASGRLTTALRLDDRASWPASATTRRKPDRARAELAEAETAARSAAAERDRAQRAVTTSEARARAAADAVQRLRSELDNAQDKATAADKALAEARRADRAAEKRAQQAHDRVASLREQRG